MKKKLVYMYILYERKPYASRLIWVRVLMTRTVSCKRTIIWISSSHSKQEKNKEAKQNCIVGRNFIIILLQLLTSYLFIFLSEQKQWTNNFPAWRENAILPCTDNWRKSKQSHRVPRLTSQLRGCHSYEWQLTENQKENVMYHRFQFVL